MHTYLLYVLTLTKIRVAGYYIGAKVLIKLNLGVDEIGSTSVMVLQSILGTAKSNRESIKRFEVEKIL